MAPVHSQFPSSRTAIESTARPLSQHKQAARETLQAHDKRFTLIIRPSSLDTYTPSFSPLHLQLEWAARFSDITDTISVDPETVDSSDVHPSLNMSKFRAVFPDTVEDKQTELFFRRLLVRIMHQAQNSPVADYPDVDPADPESLIRCNHELPGEIVVLGPPELTDRLFTRAQPLFTQLQVPIYAPSRTAESPTQHAATIQTHLAQCPTLADTHSDRLLRIVDPQFLSANDFSVDDLTHALKFLVKRHGQALQLCRYPQTDNWAVKPVSSTQTAAARRFFDGNYITLAPVTKLPNDLRTRIHETADTAQQDSQQQLSDKSSPDPSLPQFGDWLQAKPSGIREFYNRIGDNIHAGNNSVATFSHADTSQIYHNSNSGTASADNPQSVSQDSQPQNASHDTTQASSPPTPSQKTQQTDRQSDQATFSEFTQ